MKLGNLSSALCLIAALSWAPAPAHAQLITQVVDIEKSQNLRANGGCLRASIFGEDGPFPVLASLAPCQNATWHPYRFLFEAANFGGGRYFYIHPRSRRDLCLGIEDATVKSVNPRVVLDACGTRAVVKGVPVHLATPNARQLWSVIPVNHDFAEGLYVIANAGLSGLSLQSDGKALVSKSGRPRVLTAGAAEDVYIADYIAGDGQLPTATQHWSGQEIWCVLHYPGEDMHAYGRDKGGAGAGDSGLSLPVNNPNCW